MPPPESRTTRTTNRGGGVETNERVLSVARGGSRDRRGGTVGPVAAQRRSARAERAPPRRGGGCVSPLFTGVGRRARRGHGGFGLSGSRFRGGFDRGESRDPPA